MPAFYARNKYQGVAMPVKPAACMIAMANLRRSFE